MIFDSETISDWIKDNGAESLCVLNLIGTD